ncbi:hypothetical protein D3C71_1209990 [compost metagenome]
MFDQPERGYLNRAGRVHEQHIARRQLNDLAILRNLTIATALAHEKAMLIIIVVGVRPFAPDQTCIGAQVCQGETVLGPLGNLADEKRSVVSQFSIEMTARRSQITRPGFQSILRRLIDAHGISTMAYCFCCAIVNMLSICAQQVQGADCRGINDAKSQIRACVMCVAGPSEHSTAHHAARRSRRCNAGMTASG